MSCGNITCGVNAFCDALTSSCKCESGFFVATDFIIKAENHVVDCLGNKVLVLSFNALAVFFSIIAILAYSMAATKWSQIKRLTLFYICILCFIVSSGVKLGLVEDQAIGVDVIVTTFYAFAIPLVCLCTQLSLLKYVAIQYKLLILKPIETKKQLKLREKIMVVVSATAFTAGLLLFIVPFITNYDTAKTMMQVALGASAICFFGTAFTIENVTGLLLKDVLEHHAERSFDLKNVVFQIRGYKLSGIIPLCIAAVMMVAAAASDDVLKIWIYFAPWVAVLCDVAATSALVFNVRGKRKSTGNTPKPQASTVAKSYSRLATSASNVDLSTHL